MGNHRLLLLALLAAFVAVSTAQELDYEELYGTWPEDDYYRDMHVEEEEDAVEVEEQMPDEEEEEEEEQEDEYQHHRGEQQQQQQQQRPVPRPCEECIKEECPAPANCIAGMGKYFTVKKTCCGPNEFIFQA